MKNDMKTIMENWSSFSEQKHPEILEEGFREVLLALSIFAGGATMLAQSNSGKEISQEQVKSEIEKVSKATKKLSDLPSFGMGGGSQNSREKIINMIDNTYSDKIIPAPANAGYGYIPAFEIPDSMQLPMVAVSVTDYKKFSDSFNLLELKDMLYGTSGKWAYNIQGDNTVPFYSKDNQQILPPSWSIMYDVFRTKTFDAIDNFERAVDNKEELEKVAQGAGFTSAQQLQSQLNELKNLIEYDQ